MALQDGHHLAGAQSLFLAGYTRVINFIPTRNPFGICSVLGRSKSKSILLDEQVSV